MLQMDPFCDLFKEPNEFCRQIEYLISSIDRTNNDPIIKDGINRLQISIENCMKHSAGRVYVHGSRLYEIAKDDSDVDLYFDIGDCFSGKIADDYSQQIELANLFVKSSNKEFVGIKIITETRVPIVRFLYEPFNLKCDLIFRSGLAVLNSKLIKLYLSIDERVRWVVIAVKHWAIDFNLVNDEFSSFSLIWMVLFVMMQYQIVPSIIDLWRLQHNHDCYYTEGWDTSICFNDNDQIVLTAISDSKSLTSNHTKWDLLRLVFKFYSNSNVLQNYVLCTIFGELLPKKTFYSAFVDKANTVENYGYQIQKFKKCKTLINNNFGRFNRIELQNPLKLCNNVIPWLSDKNMELFIDMCTKSANSM